MSQPVCVQRTGMRTETASKAWSPGESAQHDKAFGFRRQGKCCGCVVKVHALILRKSALHALGIFCNKFRHRPCRVTMVQASPAAADGDELRTMGSTCKRGFIAPVRVTWQVMGRKSADAIVAKCRE